MYKLGFLNAVLAFSLLGCATPPVVVNYAPSSLLQRTGKISVSDFEYEPHTRGLVKANEIPTTTMGTLYLEKDISRFIGDAMKLEFKFVGIVPDPKNSVVISGKILRFDYDDLGFNSDIFLDILYKIGKDGKDCLTQIAKSHKRSPKFANPTGIISETIKDNIELVMSDPRFSSCIN